MQIEVFQAGRLFQFGEAQPGDQSPVITFVFLAVGKQAQTFQETEAFDVRHLFLFLQRLEHAGELESTQLVESRVCQHDGSAPDQWK